MRHGRPDWVFPPGFVPADGGTRPRSVTGAEIRAGAITVDTLIGRAPVEPFGPRTREQERHDQGVKRRHLKRAAARHVASLIRAAGELVIGYDLSRYDEQAAVDRAAFVIVNVDDPDLGGKLTRAISQGKPWGGYKWIYSGSSGWNAATECAAKLRRFGEPTLGSWADYEENGNTHGQLVDFFHGLDSVGARGGYYSNDWRVDHAALIRDVGTRWYWTAGYPGDNSGAFPGWGALRTSRPAQLWQFTSTNGTRDQNAVVDLAWYASLGGAAPEPEPASIPEDDVVYDEQNPDGSHKAYWVLGVGDYVEIPEAVGKGAVLNGHKLVPIKTTERITMGVAAKAQAEKFLADYFVRHPVSGDAPATPADVMTAEEKAALRTNASELRSMAAALDALSGT